MAGATGVLVIGQDGRHIEQLSTQLNLAGAVAVGEQPARAARQARDFQYRPEPAPAKAGGSLPGLDPGITGADFTGLLLDNAIAISWSPTDVARLPCGSTG